MNRTFYDCDCDCVIEMERMGVGIEEILQYARSVLTRADALALLASLESVFTDRGGGDTQ